MDKEFKVYKVDGKWFELVTVNTTNQEETISKFKKETVLDIYGNLKNNLARVDKNISEKSGELNQFDKNEEEFAGKYTDEDVQRFVELSALAESRKQKAGIQGQYLEATEIKRQIQEQIKQIELAIPELKRL
jgi:hypothetical protein